MGVAPRTTTRLVQPVTMLPLLPLLVLASFAALVEPIVDQSTTFRVAELKPHFGCTDPAGQNRVRDYVSQLVAQRFGLIALIQTEFQVAQPEGYSAFGAACVVQHSDAAVVLFDTSVFLPVKAFGADTQFGNFSSMPYLYNGTAPTRGGACLGVPSTDGERAYTAAVLRHISSGQELCVVSGTFPHRDRPLGTQFDNLFSSSCSKLPTVIIADTNSINLMSNIHRGAGWANCSDPGQSGASGLTCCHDIKRGHPDAMFPYDRTAICQGGTVDQFVVEKDWICNADEEHKFTQAVVHLPIVVEI